MWVFIKSPDYIESTKKLLEIVRQTHNNYKLDDCCCSDALTYKLKPCPWCGETTCLHFRVHRDDHTVVQCGKCHRIVKAADAVGAWNDLLRKENTND